MFEWRTAEQGPEGGEMWHQVCRARVWLAGGIDKSAGAGGKGMVVEQCHGILLRI